MSTQSGPSARVILESSSIRNLPAISLRSRKALQQSAMSGRCAAHAVARIFIVAVAAVALSLSLLTNRAEAGVSAVPPDLSLTIGFPSNSVTIPISLTAGPGGGFVAQGNLSAPIFSMSYHFDVIADPSISGSFTLTNLSSQTQTFSVAATLGVLPIAGPTSVSGFYGPLTLTAPIGTPEATLTANPFYEARLDGAAIASLSNLAVTTSGGTATILPEAFSNHAGPGVSSSIGAGFPGFTLTALDTVQVPFNVTVVSVPEPASAVLFGVGLVISFVVALRRRRTDARRVAR